MKFTVITLPEAENNVYLAAEYWAEHQWPQQAQRWWNEIWAAIHSLADCPQQWPLAAENEEFPYEIRERHFGLGSYPTHRIIFTIRDAKVYVVAVHHVAQDKLKPSGIGPLP